MGQRTSVDRTCISCGTEMLGADYRADAKKCRTCGRPAPAVLARVLAERDGPTCRLCGVVVDVSRFGWDRWGPVTDHVIPVARGGANVPGNCQLAHNRCNASKRDRLALPAAEAAVLAREAREGNARPPEAREPTTCGRSLHPRTPEFGGRNAHGAWVCRPCTGGRVRSRRAARTAEQRQADNDHRRARRFARQGGPVVRDLSVCPGGLHPRDADHGSPNTRGDWSCRPCGTEAQRRSRARRKAVSA